ncbi:hypothetical protein EUGRSUZ_J02343 [Eucalyptus grandis]|uniref:Uncharacterized protein n=2 Tax=Eucalyptus grandis TaxID=71139 RepID=A0ACC3J8H1_EUCGR|nr:hypothetical protein EUGRSUZ_J02343 [Eucalyptus grandis]
MALQEQLDKFKKQQEKCQSTLTSILARAGSMSTPAKPMPAPPAAPVGAQMKHFIDLLYESRLALTPEQINKACYVDMLSNKAVFDNLANNPKSKHDVKDKNKLLKLIRSYTEGIKVIDPKDAYPTVMEDLQAYLLADCFTGLKAAGQVWLPSNFDSQEDIAYPNDPKQLFRSIELPRDMIDIENDLQENRMKPSTNTTQRRLAAQIHGTSQKPKLKKKTFIFQNSLRI